MVSSIEGTYFSPGSSRPISAGIEKNENGYRVVGNESVLNFCGEKEVRVSNRLSNSPRKFYFPNGGQMTVADSPLFNDWFESNKNTSFFRSLSYYESNWKLPILALISIPLLFFALFQYVIPLAAYPIAKMIPPHYAEELDQFALSQLENYVSTSKLGQLEQLKITAAFDQVQSALPDLPMRLYIRDGKEYIGANAFALPGGSITITDQVIDAGLNTAEITSIFAHEAGHVYYKHSLQQLVKSSSVGVTLTLLFNDLSAISQWLLVSGGTVLQTMSYSRDAEREADEFSRQLLSEFGVSTGCFASAIKKITSYDKKIAVEQEKEEQEGERDRADQELVNEENQGETDQTITEDNNDAVSEKLVEWFSTHPSDEEREAASPGVCPS